MPFIKCKLNLNTVLHIFSSCDPHFWLKFSLLSFRSLIRSLMERSLTLHYFWKMITMRRTCLEMGRVAQLWESLPSIKTINRSFSACFICELFYYHFSIKLFYYSERNSRGSVTKCWKYIHSSFFILSTKFKSVWNIFSVKVNSKYTWNSWRIISFDEVGRAFGTYGRGGVHTGFGGVT